MGGLKRRGSILQRCPNIWERGPMILIKLGGKERGTPSFKKVKLSKRRDWSIWRKGAGFNNGIKEHIRRWVWSFLLMIVAVRFYGTRVHNIKGD